MKKIQPRWQNHNQLSLFDWAQGPKKRHSTLAERRLKARYGFTSETAATIVHLAGLSTKEGQ